MSYIVNLVSKSNLDVITTTNISDKIPTGFSFTELLDDTLDTGSIVVRGLTTSNPYTMFDTIEVYEDTSLIFSMRIAGDSVTLISKRPKLYEHTLTLTEHTKILELFTVSAKTFTQPTDGTIDYSLFDVIDTLRLTTPLETSLNLLTTRLFVMPTGALDTYLKSIDAPEFTFNNLTLREALKQVCDYVDGIPRLVRKTNGDYELAIDFVSELKAIIDVDGDNILSEATNQDISLYATQIESESLNLVNDALPSEIVEIYPSGNGYITYRKDTFLQKDFGGSYITTPKPIYNVEKVVCLTDITVTLTGVGTTYYNGYTEIDIIDRIVEKKEYDLLEYDGGDASIKYKSTTLFYNYKQKNITLGIEYGFQDLFTAVYNVLEVSIYNQGIADGSIPSGTDIGALTFTFNDNKDQFMYKTHYIPIPKATRINIDRNNLSDVNKNSVMLANQQARVINLENFTNNLQGKINRIGNSDLELKHRALSYNSSIVYNIGDYTDEYYIITTKESIFFKDYVRINYGLTKDFNKVSSFIGVNSEIRQWDISEKNTVDRKLVYKEYVEIDVVASGNGSSDSKFFTTDGRETFLDTFKASSTLEPVRGGMMNGTDIPVTVILPMSSNGGGNSLIFTWELPDNKTAGFTKEDFVPASGITQTAKRFIPYATDDGKSEDIEIHMYDTFGGSTPANQITRAELVPETSTTYINKTLMVNTDKLIVKKDNREVLGGTIQQQIIAKRPRDIIIGRWLSLRNRLVSENPPTTLKIYRYNNGFKFNQSHNFDVPTGYFSSGTTIPTIDVINNKITISNALSTDSAWCISDENDKILLAVNQDGTLLDTITFDFNNKRSGVNYKY